MVPDSNDMAVDSSEQLSRLFSPRHIAVFGGRAAAEVVRQCRKLGYSGDIWPVHPKHLEVEGLRCYLDVAALPAAPDASFVAVPREGTIQIVRELALRGSGGVICYASGFSEVGDEGVALQRDLVRSTGDMALLGPNCYGMINYLDGVALWPDQHGGERLDRGVAVITQSGNIGLNLTMQRRNLPLAYLITVGNKAGTGIDAIVDALLQDGRVTAIGLHLEGLDDVAAFSRVALKALNQGVPLVVLKSGSSELGARTTMSHTSSLSGPDQLYDTLFARFGIARVLDPASMLETLKLLHVHGSLAGNRIISASCSGGEASLVADLAQPRGLMMPALPNHVDQRLRAVLGAKVTVTNPLDYHTYIWGDSAAQTACFSAVMGCNFDMHMLVLDFPRADRCDCHTWQTTLDAFVAAKHATGASACVVASLGESMPDAVAQQLMNAGLAPMQGMSECMDAIHHAAAVGSAQRRATSIRSLDGVRPFATTPLRLLNEVISKKALAEFGVPIPRGAMCDAATAVQCADRIGYPVALKMVSDALTHKTEVGGVCLNLYNSAQVQAAVLAMADLSDCFLIEEMSRNAVIEMIIGVRHDPQFGLALTIGAGGVLVELLNDVQTLLLPISRQDVLAALHSLRCWPLLQGFRGGAEADVDALTDVVMSIADYARANSARLEELDVNPVMVGARGRGVMAVDAVLRVLEEE